MNIADIHRVCVTFEHMFHDFYVPGGGSSKDTSFGNIEVRSGGHGGYGVSMPSIEKYPNSRVNATFRRRSYGDFPMNPIAEAEAIYRDYEYQYSRDYTLATKTQLHVAPSIPWSSKSNNRFRFNNFGTRILEYSLPWGSTVEINSNNYNNWVNNGYKVYDVTSMETPNLPAPLGGSGGIGVTWFGVSDENPYDVHSIEKSFDFFNYVGPDEPNGNIVDFGKTPSYIERVLFSKINGVVITSDNVEDYHPPQDVFQVQQERIRKNILFGEIELLDLVTLQNYISPTIALIEGSSNLFSTTTKTGNNTIGTYSYNFKNTGAIGGINEYRTVQGNYVDNDFYDGTEYLPDSGDDYGQGGGGGGASYVTDWNEKDNPNIKGQNGGNGADGIVIIVAEEL